MCTDNVYERAFKLRGDNSYQRINRQETNYPNKTFGSFLKWLGLKLRTTAYYIAYLKYGLIVHKRANVISILTLHHDLFRY